MHRISALPRRLRRVTWRQCRDCGATLQAIELHFGMRRCQPCYDKAHADLAR